MNKQPLIAIRREDKNQWERRAPLTPADVQWLAGQGISTLIQPSPIRIFPMADYLAAGAREAESMDEAEIVLAIKEIPVDLLRPNKTYLNFSHTIKGQHQNMPTLRRLMELKCNLIDYERIVDDQNRRLIFFGPFAGMAGMIETLKALGEKLQLRGAETPLLRIRHAYEYASLEAAKAAIAGIGEEIAANGYPLDLAPLTVGFAGYGNVSHGAQEIFDLLPFKTVSPEMMVAMVENFTSDTGNLYKLVFKEEDLVRRRDGGRFDLTEYFASPELYESKFENYIPFLTVLVNGIYWTDHYPRLVTRHYLHNARLIHSQGKLQVIGDISCDIEGSIEITTHSTKPDAPCFTYFPDTDAFADGVQRLGVTVMAVDNLPCEFSRESSQHFSSALRSFLPAIVAADFDRNYESLALPPAVKRALILHHGELTPPYRYLEEFLRKEHA